MKEKETLFRKVDVTKELPEKTNERYGVLLLDSDVIDSCVFTDRKTWLGVGYSTVQYWLQPVTGYFFTEEEMAEHDERIGIAEHIKGYNDGYRDATDDPSIGTPIFFHPTK